MKIVRLIKNKADFIEHFCNDVIKLWGHPNRIKVNFFTQKVLKENLSLNDVYIYTDFAEDYCCRSNE